MRVFVAAALLVTTILAGCSGADKDADAADALDPSHEDLAVAPSVVLLLNVTVGNETFRFTSGNLSLPPGSAGNGTTTVASGNSTTAAAGNATAGSGNATADPGMPSGPAPLNVTFELGAQQLTNKSGLRWSLAARNLAAAASNATGNATGNSSAAEGTATGMTLPATVDRTYNESGAYEVTYSLQRGNKTLATLDVTVTVANGTATVQAPVDIPFTVEGTITLGTQGNNGCGATGSIDIGEHEWDLTAVSSITKIVVHMDLGSTNVDSDIYLLDPAGVEIGGSEDFNQPGVGSGSPTEDFEVEGPLPPGLYSFLVTGCVGIEAEYTITATASALA